MLNCSNIYENLLVTTNMNRNGLADFVVLQSVQKEMLHLCQTEYSSHSYNRKNNISNAYPRIRIHNDNVKRFGFLGRHCL